MTYSNFMFTDWVIYQQFSCRKVNIVAFFVGIMRRLMTQFFYPNVQLTERIIPRKNLVWQFPCTLKDNIKKFLFWLDFFNFYYNPSALWSRIYSKKSLNWGILDEDPNSFMYIYFIHLLTLFSNFIRTEASYRFL